MYLYWISHTLCHIANETKLSTGEKSRYMQGIEFGFLPYNCHLQEVHMISKFQFILSSFNVFSVCNINYLLHI
jgi:hypothetical protein